MPKGLKRIYGFGHLLWSSCAFYQGKGQILIGMDGPE